MLMRQWLTILACSIVLLDALPGRAADPNLFTQTDPEALTLVQSYKHQRHLSDQPGMLLVYFLTDDNSTRKLAVRCHWLVPAKNLDEAFNDDKNKVRSRIVINKEASGPDLQFKINIIDDTRTAEKAVLKSRITPGTQPITLANWHSTNDKQPRHNVVMIEYPD